MGENALIYRREYSFFSMKMLKPQARKKAEAQRKWRAKNPDAEKKYNPQAAKRYFERYHADWQFRGCELDRQREYYEQNREKILARIKAGKARKKG